MRDALDRIVDQDRPELGRLSYANISVSFEIEEDVVTVRLNRLPIEVSTDDDGDVRIRLSLAQAARLAEGALPLPEAVVRGDVQASGPVLTYLEVDPILQSLLAEAAGRDPHERRRIAGDGSEHTVASEYCAIETRDLHKAFGGNRVLRGLDVAIPAGTISVLLGPSGTGKSVLLQHVIGILKPDRGEVMIRGRALSSMSRSALLDLRREIGVMFQEGALFSAMTIYDNVAFPLRQHSDLSESDIRGIVLDHLRSVGLEAAKDRMPNELSGGMKKRAGLARALVLEPSIVLCDEPDSGLDPVRTALLGDLLVQQHAEHGGTMVVVTHNVMLAKRIADHISVVWRGEVLEAGMAVDVLASGSEFVQQFLAGETIGPLGMDA